MIREERTGQSRVGRREQVMRGEDGKGEKMRSDEKRKGQGSTKKDRRGEEERDCNVYTNVERRKIVRQRCQT